MKIKISYKSFRPNNITKFSEIIGAVCLFRSLALNNVQGLNLVTHDPFRGQRAYYALNAVV